MVVISVSFKPKEEDALQELLDSLKGSFVIRMSGTIDQIASQMGMPCYRCGGPVNWSKRKSPNDETFMLYMLREQDVTIESIPTMINGGFENLRASKDVRKMCETMRCMCIDCKNMANPIEDVQVLDHRSLSDKAESETPSSSRGSHTPTEAVEQTAKKSEKKRTIAEAVAEEPVKKIPKIEILSALDDFEELQTNTIRSMLLAKHIEQHQDKAGDSPSTSGSSPANQEQNDCGDSKHNTSLFRNVKEEILEESLQERLDAATSNAGCASNDAGVEVMKFLSQSFSEGDYATATAEIGTDEVDITSQFDIDAKDIMLGLAGLNGLNVVVPKRAPRRSAPAPVSVNKSLSSTFDNIVTIIHYDWQQAQCKKCRKTLKVKDGAGWKNRIKVTAMSHVRKHMSIEPFFCEVCQWGCNHYPSIIKHMMANHPSDRDRFQDRTTYDSFIEEAAKVLYECFDCIPPKIN